jgi:hypothetical protein
MNHTGNIVDPESNLDWSFNWSDWLDAGETITTKTITVTEGSATVSTATETNGIVTAFVSVPVASATTGRVKITCHIVTSSARTDDRSIILIPQQR